MKLYRIAAATLIFAIGIIFIVGSASTRSTRINDAWESPYYARYEFDPGPKAASPADYTVGILEVQFVQKKNDTWYYRPEDMYLVEPFQREVANSIEKILINKGCKVAGPFKSYEEMTFPERDRCDFLIEPKLIVDLNYAEFSNTFKVLNDVGGPNMENFAYAKVDGELKGSVEMTYVILDPLTAEKLERHKLITDNVSQPATLFMQGYYNDKNQPTNWKELKAWEKENPKYRGMYNNYSNLENVSKKLFLQLYNQAMPEINRLISVAEFDHLRIYQQKLEQKKRY